MQKVFSFWFLSPNLALSSKISGVIIHYSYIIEILLFFSRFFACVKCLIPGLGQSTTCTCCVTLHLQDSISWCIIGSWILRCSDLCFPVLPINSTQMFVFIYECISWCHWLFDNLILRSIWFWDQWYAIAMMIWFLLIKIFLIIKHLCPARMLSSETQTCQAFILGVVFLSI